MIDSGISIVIPAFNEENNITNSLNELDYFLKALKISYEIIVVDDGSNDLTADIAKSLAKEMTNLRLISHTRNLGIGAALKTGFDNAKYELIFWLAADGQLPANEIKRFLDNFYDCDMLISTYIKRQDSFLRYVVSSGWRVLLKTILNYNLKIDGPYLFKRELLLRIPLHSKTGLMNIEFPNKAKEAGFKIKSIAVMCLARRSGKSKVLNLRTILKTIREMLKLRFKELIRPLE